MDAVSRDLESKRSEDFLWAQPWWALLVGHWMLLYHARLGPGICGWNPWTLLKFNFFTEIFHNFWLRVLNNYNEEQHLLLKCFLFSHSKYFSELYCKSASAPPFNKKLYYKQTSILVAVFSSGSLQISWKLANAFPRTGLNKNSNSSSVTSLTHSSPINKGIIGKM